MKRYLGELVDVRLALEGPDGNYLRVEDESGDTYILKVTDALALVAAVEPLREHLEEGRAAFAEWRSRESRGALDEPLSHRDFDYLAYAADLGRKAVRESA